MVFGCWLCSRSVDLWCCCFAVFYQINSQRRRARHSAIIYLCMPSVCCLNSFFFFIFSFLRPLLPLHASGSSRWRTPFQNNQKAHKTIHCCVVMQEGSAAAHGEDLWCIRTAVINAHFFPCLFPFLLSFYFIFAYFCIQYTSRFITLSNKTPKFQIVKAPLILP